jgi:hypothetical protein
MHSSSLSNETNAEPMSTITEHFVSTLPRNNYTVISIRYQKLISEDMNDVILVTFSFKMISHEVDDDGVLGVSDEMCADDHDNDDVSPKICFLYN